MTVDFDMSFDRLIGNEGGYVNDPADPGGETNWGICKRSYPNVDIKNLTRDGAKEIYRRDFWDVLGDIPAAVKFQAFDFAVNSSIQTSIRKLQDACGAADDGHWGEHSAAACKAMDVSNVIMRFAARRLRFYAAIKRPESQKFKDGWMNRVATNLDYGAQDNS